MKFKPIHFIAAAETALMIGCCASAAETHSYSLQSGTYSSTQLVRLTPDEGVDLYYTTDGTLPDTDSEKASGKPLIIAENTRIRCSAYKDGECVETSAVSVKIRAAAPKASAKSGTYFNPFGVTLSCADKEADIYYTTDGSVPSKKSTLYTGTIPITEDTTLKFITYKSGCSYSKYATRKYVISNEFADSECKQLFDMVNDYRVRCGLDKLETLPALTEAAQLRAKELCVLFSHYRPNGTKWDALLADAGLRRSVRAENLAGFATAEEAFNFWVNSYYHNANMLNPQATSLAVGHYEAGGSNYWILLLIGEE